jgi:hypothetical protein
MKPFPVFPLTLFVAASICLRSAWCDDSPKAEVPPDPCITDLTLEKLDNPPERKTKFERIEQPATMELANVKLVDQRYVAKIRILLPYNSGDPYSGLDGNRDFGRESEFLRLGYEPREVTDLQVVYRWPLMSRTRVNLPTSFLAEAPSATWQRMLTQIPADRQPAEEQRKFFTAPVVRDFVSVDMPKGDSQFGARFEEHGGKKITYRPFNILAATPEQAEQRAKALLTILDQGYSRPLQLNLFKQRGKFCQEFRESETKLAAIHKEYQSAAEEFKQFSDFPDETLTGLRVQLFQWEAELAGLRAKIEACDKLLKGDGTAERRKQIEEAKVAAEIELAGCEGRRAKSAEFIDKVKQRSVVKNKRDLAAQQFSETNSRRDQLANGVRMIDQDIDMFGPVRLVDDAVTIQPVEWTKKPDSGPRNESR